MKKIYLTLSVCLAATFTFAQNGQIENGGFENWTTDSINFQPEDWGTADELFPSNFLIELTNRSEEAQDGNYSAQINVVEFDGDTTFGFIYQGQLDSNGPSGGFSYTDDFNEVQFEYQSDLSAGDSLFVFIIRYTGGVPTSAPVSVLASTETQSNWTTASVMIPEESQDAVFIGFAPANPEGGPNPSPNSWVRIDNVRFFNNATPTAGVPNHSFENWTSETVENPDNWFSSNIIAPSLNVNKSTDANSGSFAAELVSVEDVNSGDIIPGILSIGAIEPFSATPFASVPYNATPSSISGSYKYAGMNSDVGFFQVIFYENGAMIGTPYVSAFTDQATYTDFTVPIALASTPDSMSLVISSGEEIGSLLTIDDLAFSGGDVNVEELNVLGLTVYPNPVKDQLTILVNDGTQSNYSIVDIYGKVVAQGTMVHDVTIDASTLSAGAYFVKVERNNTVETTKVIVE